ncbi:MAG: glycosyltransferase family 2 protein [Acidimicrobiales bacterium]
MVDSTRLNVLVVMPAYNAERTLADTWARIPWEIVDQVVLVDDGSADGTVHIAQQLAGVRTIALPHNVGYGGNQKVCYLEALRSGADIVVMLHPDGQYDPEVIPHLVEPIKAGQAEMALGSRMLVPGTARQGGMPLYRFVSNRVLTMIENLIMRTHFSELHTGYRAYSANFLRTVPFMRNNDRFVFDTQIIAQAMAFEQRVVEVPIQTRYAADSSSTSMAANMHYGVGTLWTMARLFLHRHGLPCWLFKP